MKLNIFLIPFVFSTTFAAAGTNLLVMGGGGEEDKPSTIFDNTMTKLGDYVLKNKFDNKVVTFNGGHPVTEGILNQSFGGNTAPFTEKSFNDSIQNYTEQILTGKIGSGSKLIVFIDSHGAIQIKDESTHHIAVSTSKITNYDTLEGSDTVSLDKLKDLMTVAKNSGVKLAILDMSCHSGNTLNLADGNSCIISATGPKHYSYGGGFGTFAYNFVSKMTAGKNLEEIFLSARKEVDDESFPMISTEESQTINRFEYKYITPYLYSFDKTNEKLSPYLIDVTNDQIACEREKDFSRLNKIIDKLSEVNAAISDVKLQKIKELLSNYKSYQDKIIKNLKDLNAEDFNATERISSIPVSIGSTTTKIEDDVKRSELLITDYKKLIADKQKIAQDHKDTSPSSNTNMLINYYQQCQARKESLLNSNPNYQKIAEVIKNYDENNSKSVEFAHQISIEEKKLYDAFYKGLPHPKNNPCKDFVL